MLIKEIPAYHVLTSLRIGQQPTAFFKYIDDKRSETDGTTDSDILMKQDNVHLQHWADFDREYNEYFSDPRSDPEFLDRQIRPPIRAESAKILEDEYDLNDFLGRVFEDTIEKMIPSVLAKKNKRGVIAGKPSFQFKDKETKETYLIMENNYIGLLKFDDIVKTYQNQTRCSQAQPINKIINYLYLNNCRFGILCDMNRTYAIRQVGEFQVSRIYQVSDAYNEPDLLKIVFYMLRIALKEHSSITSADSRTVDKTMIVAPDEVDPSRSAIKPRILVNQCSYSGCYRASLDLLQSDFRPRVQEIFSQVDEFELVTPRTILGYGRSGCVSLGYVRKLDGSRFSVAAKLADIWSERFLKQEMHNEARVMVYANLLGVECVPKLLWHGRYGLGGQFYVNAVEYIKGVHLNLDSLNSKHKEMFRNALVELRSANIVHNDLKARNVIFTPSKCYIIDFGMAEIVQESSTWSNLEYHLDMSLGDQLTK